MADTRITINGQHYDSPDAMPPDVRRLYVEAMRTVGPSLASGQGGGNTQVITGHLGEHFGASVVVNRTITVNNRTFKNADALPPEARQFYEDALKRAAAQSSSPQTGLHLSVSFSGPHDRALDGVSPPAATAPRPIEPSSTADTLRSLPATLAVIVVIALILWALLDH